VRDALVVGAHPNNGNVAAVSERTFGLYSLTFSTNTWTMVTAFANAVDHKAQSFVITPGGKEYYSLFDGGAATPGGLFMGTATSTDIGTLSSAGVPLVNDSNPAAGVAAGAWRVRLGASSPETHAYLIMYDSLPYSTTNGGATWARILAADTGFQRLAFLDITEKNSAIVVGSTNKGIYRSIDGGAHFSPLATTGLTQTALSAVLYTPGGVLFGGDFGGQMWCSVDDGATWNAVTGGNLGASIKDMKYLNGAVHVLTDGAGIWKKDGVCS
jgi:hypothetical protein